MNLSAVCQKANAENFILLSGDTEVKDRALKEGRLTSGLLFVQFSVGISLLEEAAIVMRLVQKHGEELLYSYTRLYPDGNIRIKKLIIA